MTRAVELAQVASLGVSEAFKNRIINGAMVIDQRNAGASISNNTSGSQYSVDRWLIYGAQASKFTAQQNAGSVTPPAGYTNYLGITSSSSYSVLSTDDFVVLQRIEGFNTADLAWGTANAATVTLSFWVRSSLTGTFGGSLRNSAANRSYPFSYTISAANTWKQKSITIIGDTTGTWLTNNGTGISVAFSLGAGSTASGTAGAWSAGNFIQPTGATSVVGTNGATFYITGVQLEVGSSATSFDFRSIGTELQLCQRYYQKSFPQATAPAQNAGTTGCIFGLSPANSGAAYGMVVFPVVMRATPGTVILYNPSAANSNWRNITAGSDVNSTLYSSSQASIMITQNTQTVAAYQVCGIHYTADGEL